MGRYLQLSGLQACDIRVLAVADRKERYGNPIKALAMLVFDRLAQGQRDFRHTQTRGWRLTSQADRCPAGCADCVSVLLPQA
jgi:hypothetical protein